MPLIQTIKARAREIEWLRRGYYRLLSTYERLQPIRRRLPEPAPSLQNLRHLANQAARRNLEQFLASGRIWHFPASEDPVVSVVIPVFNRADLTLQCLEALASEASVGLEVIVIDNASSDETPALFSAIEGIRYVRNERNLHFLDGSNQGASLARGTFVLFLNSDTALVRGCLAVAVDTARTLPRVGAVGGRLLLPDGTLQEAGSIVWNDGTCLGYGRGDDPARAVYQFRRPVDFCSGAFLLTPRALFEELGGFDVDFRPAYYEEVDYCLRLWERGYSVIYEPRAMVWHFEFASSTQVDATQLMQDRQALLVSKHSSTLSQRTSPGAKAVLEARRVPNRGQLRVLWIDERIPHSEYGAGYPRAREILRALHNLGYAVTMYPAVFQEPGESWSHIYRELPRDIEVAALTGFGPEALEQFLIDRQTYYDRVFVSRPETMRAIRKITRNRPELIAWDTVVYDAEAIFTNRERLEAQANGVPMTEAEYRSRLSSELSLANGVSSITTVSEAEAAAFAACGVKRTAIVSHVVTPRQPLRAFNDRAGILFVGAIHGDGGPNHDGVMWFCELVLPILRRNGIKDIFYVVGFNRMTNSERLRRGGVEIVGQVDALDDWYDRCRVFVAPTRFAAGIPLKVVEAVAAGIPAVITPLLSQQLGWSGGDPLPTAESPEQFAAEVARLLTDEAHWHRTKTEAAVIVGERFSASVMENALRTVIGDVEPCHRP
jgi:O-antigen biosynthesis protein